jgi:hypothetical protein
MSHLLTWPFLGVMVYWPYVLVAQVGFFVLAFVASLMWPKTHPKWMTHVDVVMAPTLVFAFMLSFAVIELAIGYSPVSR